MGMGIQSGQMPGKINPHHNGQIEGEHPPEQDRNAHTARCLEEHLEELRIETLLSGEYDRSNAILTLHAGAGGTESCDWCQMLMRMYTRWAERHGYDVKVLDYLDGDDAGITQRIHN